jgi:MoxR-like ATPase
MNPSDWNRGTHADPSQDTAALMERVLYEVKRVVVGQDHFLERMLVAILAQGHLLIEGVPGLAKTLTVNTLAQAVRGSFKRIQFTPDLLPADLVGTRMYNQKTSEFSTVLGPVFANLLLADEINRAPAKTQAALFEVMEERQVTIDGKTIHLEKPFVVLATQNPFEQEGTYKLPEAQLDRFLFRIKIGYPSLEDEIQILNRFKGDFEQNSLRSLMPVANAGILANAKNLIERIHIQDELIRYIATIIDHTRNSGDLMLGGSPRASLAILKSAKAMAALAGRDFVTPEDIQKVLVPVLNHRIILHPEKELEGIEPEEVIFDIVQRVEIPR